MNELEKYLNAVVPVDECRCNSCGVKQTYGHSRFSLYHCSVCGITTAYPDGQTQCIMCHSSLSLHTPYLVLCQHCYHGQMEWRTVYVCPCGAIVDTEEIRDHIHGHLLRREYLP